MNQEKLIYLSGNEAITYQNGDAILLDVRPEFETTMHVFGLGKIIYIPHTETAHRFHELPADKTLIVADAVGLRSKEVCFF